MNVKDFTRVGASLLFLSALSSAHLFADTYTVSINSGTLCTNTATGNTLAYCAATQNQASASISLQQIAANSTQQALSLRWTVNGSFGLTYKLSIASLTPGTYNIQTPTGTVQVSTVNGYLNYQYPFTATCSGSGSIIIGPATPATTSASFTTFDSGTEGTWTGKYGAAGYVIPADASSLPSYFL